MALLPEVAVTFSAIIFAIIFIVIFVIVQFKPSHSGIFFVAGFILDFRRGPRQLSRPVQDEFDALCRDPSTKVRHDRLCRVPFRQLDLSEGLVTVLQTPHDRCSERGLNRHVRYREFFTAILQTIAAVMFVNRLRGVKTCSLCTTVPRVWRVVGLVRSVSSGSVQRCAL